MRCPKCGKQVSRPDSVMQRVFEDGYYDQCLYCGKTFNRRDPLDPAELLRLIEKAEEHAMHDEIYDAIKSYLSGDPSTLKKLAGEG